MPARTALLGVGVLALLVVPSVAVGAGLEASFADDEVLSGETATLHVDGADSETIRVSSPNLSTDRVVEVVGGTPTTDGGTLLEVPANGSVIADFDGFYCRPGRYLFEFRHDGGTATARIHVLTTGDAKTTIPDSVYRIARGGVAAIQIHTFCREVAARLSVAGERYAGAATVTIDGPGSATVRVDTGTAGDGNASTTFAVSGNATLMNTTVGRDETDPPLPTGEYDLSLVVDGEETDVSRLSVASPTDTSTLTVARTATLTPSPDRTATTTGPHPSPASTSATPSSSATRTTIPGFGAVVAVTAVGAVAFALRYSR